MNIILNNQPIEISANQTVLTFLISLGLSEKRLALLRNGALLPRSQYADVLIEENDVLDVIHAIGGG